MEDHRLPKCVLFSELPALRTAPMVHARGGGTSIWMTLRRLSHGYQHVDGKMQPRTVRSGVPFPVDHPRYTLPLATVAPAAACSIEAATCSAISHFVVDWRNNNALSLSVCVCVHV